MKKKTLISKELDDFYNKASEETRLEKGMGIFEFERIKELIELHVSNPKATIIDVGGGTGKYSEWLAKKGHIVHLVEPVLKHIKLAEKRAHKLKNPFSVAIGEAKKLPFKNETADLVILHGPLYHLQKREDRVATILEAKRVLKKGGIILGFAINATASTVVGLMNGMIHANSFFEMCKEELTTGIHNAPKDFPFLLADAFYHKPQDLKAEFLEQNLNFINLFAVEGMIWLDNEYFANMLDKKKSKTLKALQTLTQNDEYLLPFSPHMMIAVKK
ncbi:class I SAM-dependent methyltransferase [Polaribacter glomeratus]|uniref:SAM-dependent methyltransferase n=1 Tax=Polaribacter glomeratus TaxID=102 RepID=A0A2S7WJC6_9FLAO|nr:class I SAM-dependent methyltransferase [Polaribacter glomeratus]PQJ77536.1 SAM-dependent methyltransferase [Polaribacter glomeratus]TXD66129.1 class I SAM-dependent methyltransferase [Polaribacter glomeratus]